jgi:hypothetical protein
LHQHRKTLKTKHALIAGILSTALFVFSSTSSYGQGGLQTDKNLLGQRNVITTAVPFLTITPDARAAGMGDIGVATDPDANSAHWNPGKLSFVQKDGGFSLSAAPWLRSLVPDVWFYHVGGYTKVGNNNRSAVGFSLRYFSLGTIEFTDEEGNPTGSDEPKEFSLDITYSLNLSKKLSLGISTRFINSRLVSRGVYNGVDIKPGLGVAGDVGAYYKDKAELGARKWNYALGAAITNMGSKITYTSDIQRDFIPINLRVGTFWQTEIDEHNKFGIGVDFNKLLVPSPQPVYVQNAAGNDSIFPDGTRVISTWETADDPPLSGMIRSLGDAPGGFQEEMKEWIWSVGMEYWYQDQLAIRAGYFNESDTKGGRKYMTLGVGIRYNVFGLDIAYLRPFTQRHPLENTLRFTLLFDMEAFSGQNSAN